MLRSRTTTLPRLENRHGFALAGAILAMVVIGAVVTAGFYAASQENRISTASRRADEALYYAEQGVQRLLGSFSRAQYQALPAGQFTQVMADTVSAGAGRRGAFVVAVRPLSGRLYFVQSTGAVLGANGPVGAGRRVGAVVRTMDLNVPMDRAMQLFGGLTISGNAEIDGEDQYPVGWTDCSTMGTHAGVVARDTGEISTKGNAYELNGDPPVVEDPSLDHDDFLVYGDTDFDELAAMADKVYPVGAQTITNTASALTADGECDTGVRSNWGAPTNPADPCHMYFPIIYAAGDLKIASSSSGQGILLVEGNLAMSGGFDFYGIVIVKGSLTTTGTGAHLNGIVMVYSGGTLDTSRTTGNSIVNFSSCAIERAVENNHSVSRAIPIAHRSWVDLSTAPIS